MSSEERDVLDFDRLNKLFFPLLAPKEQEVRQRGNRFVYYTTAAVALEILQKRQFWMRNALLMNDFSEIDYGYRCLTEAYRGEAGRLLIATLGELFPGLPEATEKAFNNLFPLLRSDTYLTCVSEHHPHEDKRGRLSMWRAYGGTTGVAIVVNGGVLHRPTNALATMVSPVFYADPEEFAAVFLRTVQGIAAEASFLRMHTFRTVFTEVFNMFRFAALCTKHPGFSEEREWRIMASPSLQGSGKLQADLQVVRGVPQRVLKIDLANSPDAGLVGLEVPELIERIIIGPSAFPEVTKMALQEALAGSGVVDAGERVIVSDIPLRN